MLEKKQIRMDVVKQVIANSSQDRPAQRIIDEAQKLCGFIEDGVTGGDGKVKLISVTVAVSD